MNKTTKTILVTGGAGFIGSNFVYLLLDERPEWRVVCVDSLTYAANFHTLNKALENPNFKFYKEDIRNRDGIFAIFEAEKPDIVVNFAAESHVDRSIENPGIFLETNILGTQVMMDACRKYGVERFHQVGTDEVYGDLPLDRPDLFFHEDTPIHTSSPYSTSKASADLLALAYHRTYGLPVTISRCSNNYGPYQFPEKLIPLMINNATHDKRQKAPRHILRLPHHKDMDNLEQHRKSNRRLRTKTIWQNRLCDDEERYDALLLRFHQLAQGHLNRLLRQMR